MNKGLKKRRKNPPARGVIIGDQVGGIWYRKGQPHACSKACEKADHWYEHRFEKKVPVIGRPDGHIEI